jgi:hypothetical protein
MNFIRNDENVGMIETMQQAYKNCEADVLVVIHNDVFVFEKDWDKRILSYFEEMPDLGAFSFFGAQGCGPVGERIQDVPMQGMMAGYSNMLEAEIHGVRMNEPWRAVSIFDGLCMGFKMDMLRKGKGFDMRYKYHHIYDRDIALESLKRGYKNIVVNVPCHHLSGLTANRSDYQNWVNQKTGMLGAGSGDKFIHDDNSKVFAEKWKEVLPLYVETDFSYRTGQQGQWGFKGDAITKMI